MSVKNGFPAPGSITVKYCPAGLSLPADEKKRKKNFFF